MGSGGSKETGHTVGKTEVPSWEEDEAESPEPREREDGGPPDTPRLGHVTESSPAEDRAWAASRYLAMVGKTVPATRALIARARELALSEDEDTRALADEYSSRLETAAELMLVSGGTAAPSVAATPSARGRHDEALVRWLRSSDIVDVAAVFASAGDFASLSVVERRHHQAVAGHLLRIAECVPETISPSEYEEFLRAALGKAKLVVTGNTALSQLRDTRELEQSIGIAPAERPLPPDHLPQAPLKRVADLEPEPYPPSQERQREWAVQRAVEIDSMSGMTSLSADFLHVCADKIGVRGLERITEETNQVCFAIYERSPPQDISLRDFAEMSDLEKLMVLTSGCRRDDIVSVLRGPALPIIARNNAELGQTPSGPCILERLLTRVSVSSLEWVVPCVSTVLQKNDKSLFPSHSAAVSAVLSSVVACQRTDKWKSMSSVVQAVPPASPGTTASLYERLSFIAKCISVGDLLYSSNIELTVEFYSGLKTKKDEATALLSLMCQKAKQRASSDSDWLVVLKDMNTVSDQIMAPAVSEADCLVVFFEQLLMARRLTLAKTFVAKVKGSDDMCLRIAKGIVDSLSTIDDSVLVAQDCLSMAAESSHRAAEDRFIDGLLGLKQNGITKVLPSAIRAALKSKDGAASIAQLVVEANPKAASKVLDLVRQFQPLLTPTQENAVFALAAGKALSNGELEQSALLCHGLAIRGHHAAWEIARDIVSHRDVSIEPRVHADLVAFCLANCPPEETRKYLGEWRALDSDIDKAPPPDCSPRQLAIHCMESSVRQPTFAMARLYQLSDSELMSCFEVIRERVAFAAENVRLCSKLADFASFFFAARSRSKTGEEFARAISVGADFKSVIEDAMKQAIPTDAFVDEIAVIQTIARSAAILFQLKEMQGAVQGAELQAKAFCLDVNYRRAVFSRLLRECTDEGLAVKLAGMAAICGVSRFDTAVEVVSWAFSVEFDGTLPKVQAIVGKQMLHLQERPADAIEALVAIFPRISGTNHARLGFFFTLLKQCTAALAKMVPAMPVPEDPLVRRCGDHQKLLARLATVMPPLDFSQLIGAGSSPVSAITQGLTAANVNSIAKLVPSILASRGGDTGNPPLSASSVYRSWVLHLFEALPSEADGQSAQDITARAKRLSDLLASSREYVKKMDVADAAAVARAFFDSPAFVDTKLSALSEAMQIAGSCASLPDDENAKQLSRWNDVATRLSRIRSSLPQRLQDEFDVVTASEKPDIVGRFAALCEGEVRAGIDCAVVWDTGDALGWPAPPQEIVEMFGALCESTLSDRIPLPPLLTALLGSVSRCGATSQLEVSFSEAVVSRVLDCLRSFVDSEAALEARLAAVELLVRTFSSDVLSRHGLNRSPVAMRASYIVSRAWQGAHRIPEVPVGDGGHHPTPGMVRAFLDDSLAQGVSPEQLQALGDVLALWQEAIPEPPMALSRSWVVLFSAMMRAGMSQDAVELRRRFNQKQLLEVSDEEKLTVEMPGQAAAAFALASPHQQVNKLAPSLLQGASGSPSLRRADPKQPNAMLCRHSAASSGATGSRDDEELYRVAVETGNTSALHHINVPLIAGTLNRREFRSVAERDAAVTEVVRAVMARREPLRAAAVLTKVRSSSFILHSTASASAVLNLKK